MHSVPWAPTARYLTVDESEQATAEAIVREELALVDVACSRFREDSDLSKVNRNAGRWVTVSATFMEALAVAILASLNLPMATLDPTVGSVLRLAGYDRDFASIVDGPMVVHAERVPGYKAISVDIGRSVVRVPEGTSLDLGATAKAFAADVVPKRRVKRATRAYS